MKINFIKLFAIIIVCGFFFSFEIPEGWTVHDFGKQYEVRLEPHSGRDGKNAVTIKSKEKNFVGECAMLQKSELGKYSGKRLKMTGWMKSENVTGYAYFWLRIDKDFPLRGLRFDNMKDKIVKGTTSWTQYKLIVDVPVEATSATYGVLLKNGGQIWFNSVTFELAADSDKTTGIEITKDANSKYLSEPTNSNFE